MRRALWVLSLVLRVLFATLAVQVSSVVHVFVELGLVGHDDHNQDCASEEPGHDCPPGCPSCHCAHGGVASLPPSCLTLVLPWGPGDIIEMLVPYEGTVPHAPSLPSVFRPPKLTSRSA
jgi:hypothetical protein